jgi:DNA-binding beta-propeller fold protein YncE
MHSVPFEPAADPGHPPARRRRRWAAAGAAGLACTAGVLALSGCGAGHRSNTSASGTTTAGSRSRTRATPTKRTQSEHARGPLNVYAHDAAGDLSPTVRGDPALVYVPNSDSNTVDEISQRTFKIVRQFSVGALPQHVTPSYNLKTLWVDNDDGNSLTPINPKTGQPGRSVPVEDPYNMYFTPDGRFAIVVAERLQRLDFRNPETMRLVHSLAVPECPGVDHMDFSANGRFAYASCEFAGKMIEVDLADQRVIRTLLLQGGHAMPQDVKLSPDGRTLFVADMENSGVWEIDPRRFRVTGFIHTGAGAHGLYPSRNAQDLYVTNREAGSISVVSFKTKRVVANWQLPLPASPDMGGVSADGRTLWLSGRYNSVVYAINTTNGHLRATIPVGVGPHGLCVWPQPGQYSLGHTGIMR